MSERRIDEVLKALSSKNSFFSELEKRVQINAIWKEMVSDFLASKTYVSVKNETLEIWSKDPVVLSELRFKAPDFLDWFKEKGIFLNNVKVKRMK